MASAFGRIDTHGDTVEPGAYAQTLLEHKAAGTMPSMLWAHAQSAPVGRWEQMAEDARGLRVAGRLNLKTSAGRDAFEHLSAGDLSGLSIGFSVPAGGAEYRGDVRVLRAVKLHEISLVTLAADSGARVTGVKSAWLARPETQREFQMALQSLGFSRREAARISEKGFGAFEPDLADIDQQGLAAIEAALRSLTNSLKG